MMKNIKKLGFLFLLTILLSAGVHKFYVSVTNMEYSKKGKSFQITSRLFIDDLEAVLKERYDVKAKLGTDEEISESDAIIERYLKTKFVVHFNGTQKAYNYLGKEFKDDLIICYLEIPDVDIKDIQTIEVQNDALAELFEEQQNVIHIKIGDKKKSFILVRENNKGMLNL